MTPEEHYREAERLVERAVEGPPTHSPDGRKFVGPPPTDPPMADILAAAQVHVTLAQVGALLDVDSSPAKSS